MKHDTTYSTRIVLSATGVTFSRCTCQAGSIVCIHSVSLAFMIQEAFLLPPNNLAMMIEDVFREKYSTSSDPANLTRMREVSRILHPKKTDSQIMQYLLPGTEQSVGRNGDVQAMNVPESVQELIRKPYADFTMVSPATQLSQKKSCSVTNKVWKSYVPAPGFNFTSFEYSKIWNSFQNGEKILGDSSDSSTSPAHVWDTVGAIIVNNRAGVDVFSPFLQEPSRTLRSSTSPSSSSVESSSSTSSL